MSFTFVGEIRMFAGNFPPAGWEFCNGQLMAISENETLFNLIGTTYGGDGQETFALPDLRGRIPIHQGTNPQTGTTYQLAEMGGVESVTLTTQQIPVHTHPLIASTANGAQASPDGAILATSTVITPYAPETANAQMAANAISPVGGSQPHENMQPFLCVDFIISLFGEFPRVS